MGLSLNSVLMPGSWQLLGLTPASPSSVAPSTRAPWKVLWPWLPCNEWVSPPRRTDCVRAHSLFYPALDGTDRETEAQEPRGLAQTHPRVGLPGIPDLHIQGWKETGRVATPPGRAGFVPTDFGK